MPRLYEVERFDAKLLRHGNEVELMAFEEPQQGRQEHRLARPCSQFVRPDSGQGDEPLRPSTITKRCRKSGECKSRGVIPLWANHG